MFWQMWGWYQKKSQNLKMNRNRIEKVILRFKEVEITHKPVQCFEYWFSWQDFEKILQNLA